MNWPLNHVMSFLVSCDSFDKIYFVWCNYDHSCSLLVTICIEYLCLLFTFSLCVSLNLKRVSCTQHIVRSCLFTYSATLCLLIGEFNPFTFKVTISRLGLVIAILLILSLPREKVVFGTFLLLTLLWGALVGDCVLIQAFAFVLNHLQESRLCQSHQCSEVGETDISLSDSTTKKLESWMYGPPLSLPREKLRFQIIFIL